MTTVTIYSKPDCHLCDEALAVLARVRRDHHFELIEHDITSDDGLLRSYFERIPVVAVDGRELFEFVVDERALRSRLASHADDLESGQ
jgi:glutaredoxin